jgi:hypothetical protein
MRLSFLIFIIIVVAEVSTPLSSELLIIKAVSFVLPLPLSETNMMFYIRSVAFYI